MRYRQEARALWTGLGSWVSDWLSVDAWADVGLMVLWSTFIHLFGMEVPGLTASYILGGLKLSRQTSNPVSWRLVWVVWFLVLRFASFFFPWSIGGFLFHLRHVHLLTARVDAVQSSKVGTTQVENPIESTKQYKENTNQRLNPINKLAGPLVRNPDPIWTYKAVPIVPPIPINCTWRGLSLRWVWSYVDSIDPLSSDGARLALDESFSMTSISLFIFAGFDSGSERRVGSALCMAAVIGVWEPYPELGECDILVFVFPGKSEVIA